MKIFLGIVYIIICAFIMGVVLKQEGKQQGLGAIGGGNTETYWSKNKGRSREGILKRMTVIAAVLFILISIGLNLLFRTGSEAATVTTDGTEVLDMEQLQELLNEVVVEENEDASEAEAEGGGAEEEALEAEEEAED